MNFSNSKKLYNKGLVNLVGAVNSPVRAFASVGGNPLLLKKPKDLKLLMLTEINTWIWSFPMDQ